MRQCNYMKILDGKPEPQITSVTYTDAPDDEYVPVTAKYNNVHEQLYQENKPMQYCYSIS